MAVGVTCGGCSLAGSYKTVAVDPPGLPYPIDRMSFDRNQRYTATWSHGGRTRTSTGQYRWDGSTLEVVESGRKPLSYQMRRRLDGKLVLTFGKGDGTVSAILVRDQDGEAGVQGPQHDGPVR
jgi:hypothetical protein